MKKIILYTLSILAISFNFSPLQAGKLELKSVKEKETKAEIRYRLKYKVYKNTLEDYIISLQDSTKKAKTKSKYLPNLMVGLIYYLFPDSDLENLYKDIEEIKEPTLKQVTYCVDKYLATKNANLKEVSFSQGNIRLSIDSGLPLFVNLAPDEIAFKKIIARAKSRPTYSMLEEKEDANARAAGYSKSIGYVNSSKTSSTYISYDERMKKREAKKNKLLKDWVKFLAKDSIKKFNNKDKEPMGCLISGYNKESKEYQIYSVKLGYFWISEIELKAALINLYQLKL